MRKLISCVHGSLDGCIEGPDGEMDWVFPRVDETVPDVADLLAEAGAIVLGEDAPAAGARRGQALPPGIRPPRVQAPGLTCPPTGKA